MNKIENGTVKMLDSDVNPKLKCIITEKAGKECVKVEQSYSFYGSTLLRKAVSTLECEMLAETSAILCTLLLHFPLNLTCVAMKPILRNVCTLAMSDRERKVLSRPSF